MKIIIKLFIFIAFISYLPAPCFATVFGGSNLGFGGYPDFTAIQPSPPYTNDQYAWDVYRQEVADYTAKAKQYLEDSNSDIKRIQESQEDAITKANAVVQQFNSQTR